MLCLLYRNASHILQFSVLELGGYILIYILFAKTFLLLSEQIELVLFDDFTSSLLSFRLILLPLMLILLFKLNQIVVQIATTFSNWQTSGN